MTAWIIAALIAGALYFLWSHRRNRLLGGLPDGKLIAADNEEQECPVLVSERYGLKGKPDTLVRTRDGQMIPIERKRARAPKRPYDGDLIQAIVYCILVEDRYGQKPPYARIQYADRWFDEPYTPERKRWALQMSQRLREARRAGAVNRSHSIAGKCRNCAQRQNCGQAL
jgi:CRISPR-associated exonuclease Cas4